MSTAVRSQKRSGLSRRSRRHVGVVAAYAVLAGWCVFSMFPVFWTYVSSIKEPQDVFALPPRWIFAPTLHNYEVVLGLTIPTEQEAVLTKNQGSVRSKLPSYFLNTLIVSAGSTVLGMVAGSAAAYALARAPIRRQTRRLVLTSVLLTRLIPPIVLMIPMYLIWRNLGILNTLPGLILAFLTFTLPFVIWMMRGFFLAIPRELEDAALIDGCSRLGALVRIVMPLVAPGLAATAIFVALFSWNEFLIAAMLGGEKAKLLTPSIFGYVSNEAALWGQLYAASGLILLPVLALTFIVQRHIATGLTGGAIKG